MSVEPLRILVIGAHPDDADIKAGGTAALWARHGHVVRLVSLTDGSAGHHEISGPPLARRRRAEAEAAAAKIGATYEVLDIPDGQLDDRLEYRHRLIRMIRDFRADLIITHRTNDYHPDHRFAGLLVQDASYMLTVPAVCPESPHMPGPPVIMLFSDSFQRPCPFRADVAVAIDDVADRVVDMLDCHVSQFYEWLPYNAGHPEAVSSDPAERRAWLDARYRERVRPLARLHRDLVADIYGPIAAMRIQLIEAFETSEYGAALDAETWTKLFPFLPADSASCAPMVRKEWVDQPREK